MHPAPPLRLALDQLYETFTIYPRPSRLDMSPIEDPADFERLLIDPLRAISVDAMSGYAMSAMTTVGEVENYKYFLPRILELAVESGVIDPQTITHKLKYGDWQQWPSRERDAIVAMFEAAFVQAIDEHPDEYLADSWFQAMAMLGLDVRETGRIWQDAASSNAMLQLTFVLRSSLLFEKDPEEMAHWSHVSNGVLRQLRAWLLGEDIRARLMSARLAVSPRDVWMLDQALEERERLLVTRLQ